MQLRVDTLSMQINLQYDSMFKMFAFSSLACFDLKQNQHRHSEYSG